MARPGAEGPDRQPTIPPASGSGATSSGAEGPDKPSATPVGLDTQDPEVQLAVLRWQGESRGVGEGHASQEPRGGWTPMDELNQQAKAGDRPYSEDLRSIFWAAPDEDFHWAHQISSWTLPGLLGMFGHSFTLRQLWGPATASGP